jgi:4-hydroxy-3-polyprenylbenzoate decarboxylase
MGYKDLQEFVGALDAAGELTRVEVSVSSELEISEIANRVMKSPGGGKALLFENVDGGGMPVLINAVGSQKRMLMSLGAANFEEITERVQKLITPTIPVGLIEKIKKLPELAKLASLGPKEVKAGVCQEVVKTGEQVNLRELPILKCWPGDGGRYVTYSAAVTVDPETGVRNVGMYRFMVLDENSLAVHWQIHHDAAVHCEKYRKRGEMMPLALVFGDDPAVSYSATAPLPPDFDELLFAGFLRQQAVEVVKCRTNNLLVPANAEIVIEGYVNPNDLVTEGPFGDHTGYYSAAQKFPRFEVKAITHRRNAIYPATIVGIPPMEDYYIGKATERLFLPLIRTVIPEIVDYHLPAYGVFHNFVFVSIRKRYPLHARKVMHAIWGLGQMMFSKFIVVVDADVDVHKTEDVLFRMGANVDPKRDTVIVDGPVDALDHAAPALCAGSKMGIDATAKIEGEGIVRPWPEILRMDEKVQAMVEANWKNYKIS